MDKVKIKLTPEHQEHVKKATGKDGEALEFKPEELEQRISPFGLA